MISNFQDSVLLITSSETDDFGTGFVVHKDRNSTYVVTCAHVVKDVGGADKVCAEGIPSEVVASGDDLGLDLAVLKIDGLPRTPLNINANGNKKGDSFITAGFQKHGKNRLIRPLHGNLGDSVELKSSKSSERIQAWDLQIVDNYYLQPGYSGSPIVNEATGDVLAVVINRQGEGGKGLAISADALTKIWKPLNIEQLYHTLLKLGYRQQVSFFRQLIGVQSVAGFLIHGLPEYGQQWLLNRLVSKYVPYSLTGQVIKIRLARKVRGNDASALWRELAGRVGLSAKEPPEKIANKVYKWWQTQNVLIVFHDVDCITESSLNELISEFWVPLANRVRDEKSESSEFKLLMFLLDYEGTTESWNVPFVEKIDLKRKPRFPVRSPKIKRFSYKDIEEWVDYEYDKLPSEITNTVEDAIETILEDSEGIPERVLEDICNYCGCNWYEVSDIWLRL